MSLFAHGISSFGKVDMIVAKALSKTSIFIGPLLPICLKERQDCLSPDILERRRLGIIKSPNTAAAHVTPRWNVAPANSVPGISEVFIGKTC